METVVIVAIGVLATIFLASFVALVVVCRHRYCHRPNLLQHFESRSVYIQYTHTHTQHGHVVDIKHMILKLSYDDRAPKLSCEWHIRVCPLRPTVDLIGAMETQSEPSELELDDVVITNPHIEAIFENEEWIEDASYVLFVTFISTSLCRSFPKSALNQTSHQTSYKSVIISVSLRL